MVILLRSSVITYNKKENFMNKEKERRTYHGTLRISDLKVLESAIGYFIGRVCVNTNKSNEDSIIRESGYFPTYRNAERALINGF